MRPLLVLLLVVAMACAGCLQGSAGTAEPDADVLATLEELATFPEWRLETDHGTIRTVLYTAWLPVTTSTIIQATRDDYYTNTTVYRVVDDFVIQGGDESESDAEVVPVSQGIPLEYEEGLDFGSGSVGLARSVNTDSGTTHYFVMEKPAIHLSRPDQADEFAMEPSSNSAQRFAFGQGEPYALFGQVFEGQDVVRAIASVDVDENARPIDDVVLLAASVHGPPVDADLLNLIPDVHAGVSVQGRNGDLEVARFVVATHPTVIRFTPDGSPERCVAGSYTLVDLDGERHITPWEVHPLDACTFEAHLTFDEPGTYEIDLGVEEIPIEVLPWSDAYAPYAGTQNA